MADVKVFHGRPVIPGQVTAPALVTHNGFNTLASFQKALLAKKTDAICSDQNNIELFNKKMAGTALCLPQTIGSTTGGLVLHTACDMGANPACMLFSQQIDSLAAAGVVLADIWSEHRIIAVDGLGEDFLNYVKDGMSVTVSSDGTVTVSNELLV
ncbi:MAG: hypothetical protein DBX47_06370 [Clostridiales bacterium]|nr:MAG: hypothetical protein DBX47_06370 [Clostridiales bacterium]